jgi:hypothetical protein
MALAAALAAATLLTTSSCASSSYATPNSLCGVPVKPELLDNLLPPGSKLTVSQRDSTAVPALRYCDVAVDGTPQLDIEGLWRSRAGAGDRTLDDIAARHNAPATESRRVGTMLVWKTGAATAFDCQNPKQRSDGFSVWTGLKNPSSSDQRRNLESFLASYAAAYKKTLPCEKP